MNWSAPVEPGDIIAEKFKVEQVLGSGGVGVVVAARHLQLDERVALKFLLPEAVRSEIDVARFCREAQAAVRLKSEHVARVTDVGTLDTGSPYMVMDYLTGRDLGEVLDDEGALPVDVAVDYVLQACEAIAEAHSIGFIHRDLKPSNLFVTHRSDGSPLVKVLDFGIAKATHQARIGQGEQELTRTRSMLGSPMYMSPEQVRNSRNVDERTDIWSLGVVLYEALTGSVPFGGDSVTSVVAAVIGDALPPLDQRRRDLPAALSDVVSTCLAKDATARYQSVAEFAYALKPFAAERSFVSIERIAGTLGPKAKYRVPAEHKRNTTSTLIAATTVKSGDAMPPRRNVVRGVLVGGALAVVATVGAIVLSNQSPPPAPTHFAVKPAQPPKPEVDHNAPIIVPASASVVVEPETAPSAVPSGSAAGSSSPLSPSVRASSGKAPLVVSPKVKRGVGVIPSRQRNATPRPPHQEDVIDGTVDTRR